MTDHKRILVLTPQLPYPPQQGTAIRNYNLIAHLAVRHRLHLVSFLQEGDELTPDSPLLHHCQRIETVPVPQRTLTRRLLTTISSPLPDMALRLASCAFQERLAALVAEETYDVVQIEGIEMAPYGLWLRAWPRFAALTTPRPRLVFDDHNAEYLLQRRVFETDVRHPRRWAGAFYSLIQWQKLSRYEAHVCRQADGVAAVSEADAEALRRLVPGLDPAVVPNGVDLEFYNDQIPMTKTPWGMGHGSLVFTGKMDFRPNVDAVLWFADEVLPRIRAARPEAHFVVVGQKPHARLDPLRQRKDVTLTGWVEDVRPYMATAAVYVAPLRMGGGTRLKLLEAMALGKAIVSTSLGCEGFAVADGRELRVANAPEAFAAAVLELLADEAQRTALGRAARRFVEARYGWEAIVPKLEQLYEPRAEES